MKKIIFISVLLVLLAVGLIFQHPVTSLAENLLYYSSCDSPISYSIGTIDEGFNITRDELLNDTKIAANIWSNSVNKKLFVYDPKSTFTINMVYDSRQELTSKITKLDNDLKQQQGSIDPQITKYKQLRGVFEHKVDDLNSRIQGWNAKGGAPKDEYDKLIADQKSLQDEGAALNALARTLGQSTQQYNSSAKKLNETIGNYQQVLQVKPEEGLYEQEGDKRKISLFIDIVQDEFLHTLSHEMGHALGLLHNQDKDSIMYFQTTQVLVPSVTDTAELQSICKEKTVFEIALTRVKEVTSTLKERISQKLNN